MYPLMRAFITIETTMTNFLKIVVIYYPHFLGKLYQSNFSLFMFMSRIN